MAKHDKSGQRLYRTIEFKLWTPNQPKKPQLIAFSADPRMGYTDRAIQQACENVAAKVEADYPGEEFRFVEIAPNRFNIIHQGKADATARALAAQFTVAAGIKAMAATAGGE